MIGTELVSQGIGLGRDLVGVLDQYVEDKDLKAKLAFETVKLTQEFSASVLATQTTPKADAFVKIMYALRDVVIPMLRPIGAAAMTAVGAWLAYKGVELPSVVNEMMIAAFPGWMTMREVGKSRDAKEGTRRAEVNAMASVAANKQHPFFDAVAAGG